MRILYLLYLLYLHNNLTYFIKKSLNILDKYDNSMPILAIFVTNFQRNNKYPNINKIIGHIDYFLI